MGTLAAAGVQYQLDVSGEELRQGGVDIRSAGEELQLLVRNFQDVGQGCELQNSLAEHLFVRPEREAQVGVKAHDGPGFPGGGDGGQMGVPHGAVHQGDTAIVQGKGIAEPGRVDLLRRIEQVGGGLTVEAEGAVAVLFQAHEGKGRVGLVGEHQMGQVDAAGAQLVGDLVAEGVIAQLGQEGALATQAGEGRADVGRCTAHPGAERGHLVKGTSHAGRDHIDQRFADGK